MCAGEHRDEMVTQNGKVKLMIYTSDMRCKYTGASGSSSKNRSRQSRTESECGGVQNRGKVCSDDTVRRAKGASDKGSVRTGINVFR